VASGADAVLLCSYHGLNPLSRFGQLEAARRVTNRATIRFLTHEFDALPRFPRLTTCPASWGQKLVAYFHYGRAREWTVVIEMTGCRAVSNGQAVREGLRAPKLFAELYRLSHFSYRPNS